MPQDAGENGSVARSSLARDYRIDTRSPPRKSTTSRDAKQRSFADRPSSLPQLLEPSSGCRTQRRRQLEEPGAIRATEDQLLRPCRWWLVSKGEPRPPAIRVSARAASRLGHDIMHGLERPDLLGHVVSEHVPGHVHQRVAEVRVDAHARQAWEVMMQEPRFLLGNVR